MSSWTKNIIHTIAVKHQLKFCHFLNSPSETQSIVYGPAFKVDTTMYDCYLSVDDNANIGKTRLFFKWIRIHGTTYKIGMIIVTGKNGKNLPQFGKINLICSFNSLIYFFLYTLCTVCFDEHAYKDNSISDIPSTIKRYDDLVLRIPAMMIFKKDEIYIATRYSICDWLHPCKPHVFKSYH